MYQLTSQDAMDMPFDGSVPSRDALEAQKRMVWTLNKCVSNLEEVKDSIKESVETKEESTSIILGIYQCCVALNPVIDMVLWNFMVRQTGLYHELFDSAPLEPGMPSVTNRSDLIDGVGLLFDGMDDPDMPILKMLPPPPWMNPESNKVNDHTMSHGQRKVVKEPKKLDKKKILSLQKFLEENLIGQQEAIDTVVKTLKRSTVGLKDDKRPLGVFLLAGSSGTGKTEMARLIQSHLFGSTSRIIRVDCGEFQQKHEVMKLTGCFVAGTKVWMADGKLKNIEDVEIGDEVITHLGNKKRVLHTHKYENEQTLKRINIAGYNHDIVCTPSHEFWSINSTINPDYCLRNRNLQMKNAVTTTAPDWHSADSLKKGDWLLAPKAYKEDPVTTVYDLVNFLPCEEGRRSFYKYDEHHVWAYETKKFNRFITVNEDFARFAGYYLAEGGNSKPRKSFNFTFHSQETEYQNEVIYLTKKIFGDMYVRVMDRTLENNTKRIYFYSRVICNFLADIFGDHTNNQKVPVSIINSDESVKINLVETAILGDGCTTIKGRTEFATISEDLYSGVVSLIRSLGYDTYSSHLKARNQVSYCYKTYISSRDQLLRFEDDTTELLKNHIPDQQRSVRNMAGDEKYSYYKVLGVKDEVAQDFVYDLTVEDDTSYCVNNGVAVHNSPNSYVGFEDGGQLTNAIKEAENTVLLLDEAEKAHPDFWNLFLKVFDEGYLTDNKGENVSFENTIVIMTSNLGNDKIAAETYSKGTGFHSDISDGYDSARTPNRAYAVRQTKESINKFFKPEFVNRLDEIIIFNYLTHDNMDKIARLEFNKLAIKLSKQDYYLKWTKSAERLLANKSLKTIQGARAMSKIRRSEIEDILAELLLTELPEAGTTFQIGVSRETMFSITKKVQRKSTKTSII